MVTIVFVCAATSLGEPALLAPTTRKKGDVLWQLTPLEQGFSSMWPFFSVEKIAIFVCLQFSFGVPIKTRTHPPSPAHQQSLSRRRKLTEDNSVSRGYGPCDFPCFLAR